MATKRVGSRLLTEMHVAGRGLYKTGAIDALTMRKLDALCLPSVQSYSRHKSGVLDARSKPVRQRLPRC